MVAARPQGLDIERWLLITRRQGDGCGVVPEAKERVLQIEGEHLSTPTVGVGDHVQHVHASALTRNVAVCLLDRRDGPPDVESVRQLSRAAGHRRSASLVGEHGLEG